MKLNFDYYRSLEQTDLYLCNPDGRELFPLPGRNRNLKLRFNDLSELTFIVDSKTTLTSGEMVELEAYDLIQTRRLIYVTNIGWFQIADVSEHDDGIVQYKSVTTESHQATFKNKGFVSEERVYCFYNPNDPFDENYNSNDEASIPSVVGQMSKQLGIKQDLTQGKTEPTEPYSEWTLTYVTPSLNYSGEGSICRTFKENVTYGYDWMVKDVEDSFEVLVLFDFLFKTIRVMTPEEVVEKVNVIYTFNNFMKDVNVKESSEDIITVLNCNGDNCDISSVNPTGTNYICDFSYYMDKETHKWMSNALISKLEEWKDACDSEKPAYVNNIARLREVWLQKTQCSTKLQNTSLILQDLKNAQAKRSVVGDGDSGALCGIVTAEKVKVGETSIKEGTDYYSVPFTGSEIITAYQIAPSYDKENKRWVFSGAFKTGSADSIISDNLSDENTTGMTYWYYSDSEDNSSYCKLFSIANVSQEAITSSHYCGGFERYIAYTYPKLKEGTVSEIEYTDTVQDWINLREQLVNALNEEKAIHQSNIDLISAALDEISSRLNILSYFSDTPNLLRELNCYWVEGEYTNENIAVLESTTPEEEIDLCNELLDLGYAQLGKVCQPRFSFSLQSIDATKKYEFREQMRLLELGKIITIEKREGLWYYPALLEISINLDNSDDFDMTFANARRLDDWGYTYADLISDASSTSRKISANWQDLFAYAKEKETISSIIKDPLDATLRASFANMVNQEFTIDKTGILGRKKKSESSDEFEDEQVRLINNVLIFTDDNWKTAKSALGKIYYKDDKGQATTSYGLIAETIIGQLIMGNKLEIVNSDNSIKIDKNGIIIKGPKTYNADGSVAEYETKFEANANTGNVDIIGNIKGGSINIANNFIVYSNGNVALNGSITWGAGNSPTQILYARSYLTKPSNGSLWSSYPDSSSTGWHKKFNSYDVYATYTYDGGNTWTDAIQIVGKEGAQGETGETGATGSDGDTIKVIYMYYRKANSTAPSTPTYKGTGGIPTGWSLTPQSVTASYPYVFVSQCTVTNDSYGTWSTPTCWAKYGNDGSDASVTDINVFNALTNNGTIFGCFTSESGKLYINASYIKATQTDTNLLIAGKTVVTSDGVFGGSLSAATGSFNGSLKVGSASTFECSINSSGMHFYVKNKLIMQLNDQGTAYFAGALQAASGTFGTGTNKFTIGAGAANTSSIYYITNSFAGIGGLASPEYNHVYIGGDGFSYRAPSTMDYTASIRPGFFFASGNPGNNAHSAVIHNHDGIHFCWGGSSNLRNASISILNVGSNYHRKAAIEAQNTRAYMKGSFASASSISVDSDRNKKHDIDLLGDSYDELFDQLIPVKYKYNDGDSGRFHTGFIAQDVLDAITKTGLTTKDFAAYTESDPGNEAESTRALRYEEFISLNTWQIQKLKARVAALEEEIAKLTNA